MNRMRSSIGSRSCSAWRVAGGVEAFIRGSFVDGGKDDTRRDVISSSQQCARRIGFTESEKRIAGLVAVGAWVCPQLPAGVDHFTIFWTSLP